MKRLGLFLQTKFGAWIGVVGGILGMVASFIHGAASSERVTVSKVIDGVLYTKENVTLYADDANHLMWIPGIISLAVLMVTVHLNDDEDKCSECGKSK